MSEPLSEYMSKKEVQKFSLLILYVIFYVSILITSIMYVFIFNIDFKDYNSILENSYVIPISGIFIQTYIISFIVFISLIIISEIIKKNILEEKLMFDVLLITFPLSKFIYFLFYAVISDNALHIINIILLIFNILLIISILVLNIEKIVIKNH